MAPFASTIHPIAEALRILGRFWLEEVQPADVATIAALPQLADSLPKSDTAALTNLAVEYQRLFGFNLPLYESVFVDPSAMLGAPATGRVQALYQRAGWAPPAEARFGALDHLGLELLALADGIDPANVSMQADQPGQLNDERAPWVRQMHLHHLALWAPACLSTLNRLSPHPFYATLGDLTLDLILATLPAEPLPPDADPFPVLPPPPIHKDEGLASPPGESSLTSEDPETPPGLRDLVKRLLVPRETGLFLTREDIARVGHALDLPGTVGERSRMLETLFRLAGQYDLVPTLCEQLEQVLKKADVVFKEWADQYPSWTLYASAWRQRLAATQGIVAELRSKIPLG